MLMVKFKHNVKRAWGGGCSSFLDYGKGIRDDFLEEEMSVSILKKK